MHLADRARRAAGGDREAALAVGLLEPLARPRSRAARRERAGRRCGACRSRAGTRALGLAVGVRGVPVQFALVAEGAGGKLVTLPLGSRAPGTWQLATRLPAGLSELIALEVAVSPLTQHEIAHGEAEGTSSVIPSGSTALGPLMATGAGGGRSTVTDWAGWLARNGARLGSGEPAAADLRIRAGPDRRRPAAAGDRRRRPAGARQPERRRLRPGRARRSRSPSRTASCRCGSSESRAGFRPRRTRARASWSWTRAASRPPSTRTRPAPRRRTSSGSRPRTAPAGSGRSCAARPSPRSSSPPGRISRASSPPSRSPAASP